MSESTTQPTSPAPAPASRRRPALLALAGLVVLAGIAGSLWWALDGRYHENTDDAYVAGDIVQITPQVAGTVLAIHVSDTDTVKAGSPLVELDPADARVALDQAEAALAQAVREVRTLYATNGSLGAIVAQREADLAKARDDLRRRQSLAGTGAVSGEEIEHAHAGVLAAEAALTTTRDQLLSNNALTDHTTVESHPSVTRAAARVEEIYLALKRATITAPVAGQVAKRSVQIGTRVAAGQPLMAIVPLDRVWVEANFKEVQLRQMRIGQTATMIADMYGSRVRYSGRVVGLGAGTGAAFALLPAQNATGNWIKIVQRLPVRIAIDAGQVAEHPLRVGLSMEVDVDIHEQSGPQLAAGERREAMTRAVGEESDDARQLVRRIITANLGSNAARPAALTLIRHERQRVPPRVHAAARRNPGRRHDRGLGGDVHERARHDDRQCLDSHHRRRHGR
jgi:membrane fusion protein (multidrug efflux system)